MKKYTNKILKPLKIYRKNGMSIPDLMIKYKIPKTSIWHHVKDIKLSAKNQKLIFSKRSCSKIKKEMLLYRAEQQADLMLNRIYVKKSGLLIFIALYLAEESNHSFVFTNTDTNIIKMFMKASK